MSVPKLTILSLFLKHVGDSMKSKKTSFLFNSRNKDESKMEASTRESGFPGRRRSRYTHDTDKLQLEATYCCLWIWPLLASVSVRDSRRLLNRCSRISRKLASRTARWLKWGQVTLVVKTELLRASSALNQLRILVFVLNGTKAENSNFLWNQCIISILFLLSSLPIFSVKLNLFHDSVWLWIYRLCQLRPHSQV